MHSTSRYPTLTRTRVVVNEVEQAIGSLNGSLNSIWLYCFVFALHVKSAQHCGGQMPVALSYDRLQLASIYWNNNGATFGILTETSDYSYTLLAHEDFSTLDILSSDATRKSMMSLLLAGKTPRWYARGQSYRVNKENKLDNSVSREPPEEFREAATL